MTEETDSEKIARLERTIQVLHDNNEFNRTTWDNDRRSVSLARKQMARVMHLQKQLKEAVGELSRQLTRGGKDEQEETGEVTQ